MSRVNWSAQRQKTAMADQWDYTNFPNKGSPTVDLPIENGDFP